jgi:hypothetical protein
VILCIILYTQISSKNLGRLTALLILDLGCSGLGFRGSLTEFYSSILREIAPRFQNFAAKVEVAPRKRVAIPTRSQLHACCQLETRRDATLVEMRREVRAMCDKAAASCYVNPSKPWYIVFTQRCNQNKKQRSCRIRPISLSMFCYHPILA